MDWSLVIFAGIVLFFAYRGYSRGLLRSLARILGVVAGYACALVFTGEASKLLEANSQLQGIVAFIVAGLGLFLGASIGVSLLFWMLGKLLGGDGEVSAGSRAGGAAVGIATGLLVAIIVIWTISFVRDTRPDSSLAGSELAKARWIEDLTTRVVGKAVGSAMSLSSANPEITRLTAALAESPGEIVQQAQRLAQSEDMTALLHDPRNQAVLNSGDLDAVRELPAFRKRMANPDMLALADSTGLIDEETRNSQGTEAALAMQITDIWGRAQRVKTDPRLTQILSDPDFRQKIQSGNPLDLLGNEKLLEVANIIFSEQPTPVTDVNPGIAGGGNAGNKTPTRQAPGKKPKPEKKVYTWTDDRGVLHVSDQPPEQ